MPNPKRLNICGVYIAGIIDTITPQPLIRTIGRNFTGGITRIVMAGVPPSLKRIVSKTNGEQLMWE